jgi:hypothetical protein
MLGEGSFPNYEPFEIRPADDLSEMIRQSERRRSKTKDE